MSVYVKAVLLLTEEDSFLLSGLAKRGFKDLESDVAQVNPRLYKLLSDLEAAATAHRQHLKTQAEADRRQCGNAAPSERVITDINESTVKQSVARTGRPERTVRHLVAKGTVLGRKDRRGNWLIDDDSLDDYFARRESV